MRGQQRGGPTGGARRARSAPALAALMAALVVLAGAWASGLWPGDGEIAADLAGAGPDARTDGLEAPPAAAAPGPGGAVLVDGDAALRKRAHESGWSGTGTAEDPLRISGLRLSAVGQNGLRLVNVSLHVRVEGNEITGDGAGDGILLEQVAAATVARNTIHGTLAAVRLVGGTGATVEDNTVTGNGYGVLLQGTLRTVVQDNRFEHNGIGLFIEAAGHSGHEGSRGAHVVDNTFIGNGMAGDRAGAGMVVSGPGHLLSGNVMLRNGAPQAWVVDAQATVRDNVVTGGTGVGLQLSRVTASQVTGNRLEGNAEAAMMLRDTSGVTVRNNVARGHPDLAIAAEDGSALRIEANVLEDNLRGIGIVGTRDAIVLANAVARGDQGIDLADNERGRVENNHITDMAVGGVDLFGADDAVVVGNTVEGSFIGVFIGAASTDARVLSNRIERATVGVEVDEAATGNTITDNEIRGPGSSGIFLGAAHATSVSDNLVQGFDHGIQVAAEASGSRVSGGVLRDHVVAVRIDNGAQGVMVDNVSMLQNSLGVHASLCRDITLLGNDIRQNAIGILFVGVQDSLLRRNLVQDNRVGLHFTNTTDNLVYDNLFSNAHLPGDTDYLLEASTGNVWNVSKRAGPNVVGGPFVAGNVWAGYDGPDADADGLGDVPYTPLLIAALDDGALPATQPLSGPIDFHPLMWIGGPPDDDGVLPGDGPPGPVPQGLVPWP